MNEKANPRNRPKILAVRVRKRNLRIFSAAIFLCILCAFFISLRQLGIYSRQSGWPLLAETVGPRLAMSVNSELALDILARAGSNV